MQNYLTMTKERWDAIDEGRKGRIAHTWPSEGLFDKWVGRRTLKAGKRRLVEGIDFVIVDG